MSDDTAGSTVEAWLRANQAISRRLAPGAGSCVTSAWSAGGDNTKNAKPLSQIKLKQARVKTFTLLMGGALPNTGSVEIFELTFREINMEASPQTDTGQRGGANTFHDTLATE